VETRVVDFSYVIRLDSKFIISLFPFLILGIACMHIPTDFKVSLSNICTVQTTFVFAVVSNEAEYSPPSSAEIKNMWSRTSTQPIRLLVLVLSHWFRSL